MRITTEKARPLCSIIWKTPQSPIKSSRFRLKMNSSKLRKTQTGTISNNSILQWQTQFARQMKISSPLSRSILIWRDKRSCLVLTFSVGTLWASTTKISITRNYLLIVTTVITSRQFHFSTNLKYSTRKCILTRWTTLCSARWNPSWRRGSLLKISLSSSAPTHT